MAYLSPEQKGMLGIVGLTAAEKGLLILPKLILVAIFFGKSDLLRLFASRASSRCEHDMGTLLQ